MHRALVVMVMGLTLSAALADKKGQEERLRKSATVLGEILKVPDGIPKELLHKAECVVVLPSVKKFAIGLGGSYGRGTMVCRSGADFKGPWGAPSMMRLEGGSIGLQLGGSATDFVLLIMNEGGARGVLSSKVKMGADATAAAGPKGRTSEAATDATLSAEILSYSRSKGLIAGISLKGSTLRPDNDGNRDLYGEKVAAKAVALEGAVAVPEAGKPLVDLLTRESPKNLSK